MPDEKKQKYYAANKEKRLEYQREYYKKNRNNIKRKNQLRRADDPEWATKQREYAREYYRANKERIRRTRIKRAALLWAEMEEEEKNFRVEPS